MQFASDTALAEALDSPNPTIRPFLEVDWNRNGLYNHAYSNFTEIIDSVTVDFASLKGSLPDEVNTVIGSSSAIMTVTLSGERNFEELRAAQLLSKYNVNSPLTTFTIEGTPIRYSRRVKTSTGYKEVRQFTGWISEYTIDEQDEHVTLTCSDVYDLQSAPVSLPVWAVGPGPTDDQPPGANGAFAALHPINASWVYGEVLRQGGRSLWPGFHPDCSAYWSCAGSMLPSKSTLADASNSTHTSNSEFGYEFDMFSVGPYGLAHSFATGSDNSGTSYSETRASKYIGVPDRGSSDTPAYICLAGWFYSNGSATNPPDPMTTQVGVWLGSMYSEAGYLALQIDPAGYTRVSLQESSSSGSSNAGALRQWQWIGAGNRLPLGWNYVVAECSFTNAAVSVALRVNGSIVAPTSTPSNLLAFKYYQNLYYNEPTNAVFLYARMTPCQHVQIYNGSAAITYTAQQRQPPYVINGTAPPARMHISHNRLNHLPDVSNKYAWDVLKEAIDGELGCLFTREDGQIWLMGRGDVRTFARFPITGPTGDLEAGFLTLNPDITTIDPVSPISRSKIRSLVLNPSADTYRNNVVGEFDEVFQSREIVWQSNDAKQFYALGGLNNYTKDFGFPFGIVSFFSQINSPSAPTSPSPPTLNRTTVTAVRADAPGTEESPGWGVSAIWHQDQRGVTIGWNAGLLNPPAYVGACLGAESPNFQIGGRKYDTSSTRSFSYSNSAEVALRGTRTLDLGNHPWRQDAYSISVIVPGLLEDTVASAPVIHRLSVPVDPRRQLLDMVKLPASAVVSGPVYAQVVGKRITDTQNSAGDQIDIRVLFGPENPAYWESTTTPGWDLGTWSP